ncbi:MAG: PAS domain S-box protein, partial [Planctomycetes bacterium]|nr:PAS domain S-box protein [Planctomycetota bacterium]
MTLKQKSFLSMAGLLTALIVAVTASTCAFIVKEHRAKAKDIHAAHIAFLAAGAEQFVIWDDRVALSHLLRETVERYDVVKYSFIEREGRPYIHTFEEGVPQDLLGLLESPPRTPVEHQVEDRQGNRSVDLALAVGDQRAILHLGLSCDAIDQQVLPDILVICALGAGAVLVGLAFAAMIARLITRDVCQVTALRTEIAERRRAEDALQEEKNLLRSLVDLLETMDVGITIQDLEYNITYQNSFMQKIFGGLGGKCYEVYEKQPKVCDGCAVEKAFADGQPHSAERTTPAPGGGVYYWDNTAHPIRDTSGEVTSCFEVVRNVTKRKRTEEALRRERDFAESLIETAQTIVLVLDTDGRIVKFNRYLEELSGYRLDEVQGKDWFTTFLPESDWNSIRDLFRQAV